MVANGALPSVVQAGSVSWRWGGHVVSVLWYQFEPSAVMSFMDLFFPEYSNAQLHLVMYSTHSLSKMCRVIIVL